MKDEMMDELTTRVEARKPRPKFGWTEEVADGMRVGEEWWAEVEKAGLSQLLERVEAIMAAEAQVLRTMEEIQRQQQVAQQQTALWTPEREASVPTSLPSGDQWGHSYPSDHNHTLTQTVSTTSDPGHSHFVGYTSYTVTPDNETHVQDILAGTHQPLGMN